MATESPLKKVKLTIEDNNSNNSKSLLLKLPNELLFHITDFLIGNNHLKEKDFLLSLRYIKSSNSISRYSDNRDEEDKKCNEYYQQYIPPFENVKTLLNFIVSNKQIYQTFIGDNNNQQQLKEWNEVDNYWLERINFYEKYLYWIRNSSFDNLLLGTGDLTAREIDEMCKTQTLIQRIERGLIVDEKDAIDKDNDMNDGMDDDDDDEEDKKKKKNQKKDNEEKSEALSQEKVNEDLFNRLQLLEFKKEDFINNEVFKNTSLFQYFFFRILMLSLKMFLKIETNGDFSDGGAAPENTLLPDDYLDRYYGDKLKEDDYYSDIKPRTDDSAPTYGLVVTKDSGWKRFCTNTKLKVVSKKVQRWGSEVDTFVLEGDDNLGTVIEQEELLKKLKKFCYIHFESVLNLTPFENLVFPDNIKYLTFSLELRDEVEKYFEQLDYFDREEQEEKKEEKEEGFLTVGKGEELEEMEDGEEEKDEEDEEDQEETEEKGDEEKEEVVKSNTCKGPNCPFFGSEQSDGYCSQCYKKYIINQEPIPEVKTKDDEKEEEEEKEEDEKSEQSEKEEDEEMKEENEEEDEEKEEQEKNDEQEDKEENDEQEDKEENEDTFTFGRKQAKETEKEKKPKEPVLLGNFSFPGVRYLNIGAKFEDVEPDIDNKILETLLQKNKFPNLTHLTLCGINVFDKLLSSNLLPQLQTLEIADGFKEEKRLVKLLNLLHEKRSELKHLKHLVVQIEIDSRNPTINSSQLEKYYNGLLENVCTSIGYSSVSRFYYACGE
ncbi:hypothetical protein ABK040_015932 [Willaertia magna]